MGLVVCRIKKKVLFFQFIFRNIKLKFVIAYTGRKSLSALHNNDNNGKVTTSMSKTYTNNKKEELLKVINEAKQKLENVSLIFKFLS